MVEYHCIIIATKEPVEVKIEYLKRKQILELRTKVDGDLEEFIKDSQEMLNQAKVFLKENKS